MNHDHVWLSETPRKERSKSFGSGGSRTLTMAAFRVVGGDSSTDNADYTEERNNRAKKNDEDVGRTHEGGKRIVLMFNTHLDVWGAEARTKQAEVVVQYVEEWRQMWPSNAAIFLTGDFNTANGHAPHDVFVGGRDAVMVDVWDDCLAFGGGGSRNSQRKGEASAAGSNRRVDDVGPSAHHTCRTNGYAATFHGWLGGTAVNSYGARLLQFVGQTVHASGVDFPKHVPLSAREALRMAYSAANDAWVLGWHQFRSAMPASLSRLHVDWILTARSTENYHNPCKVTNKPLIHFICIRGVW